MEELRNNLREPEVKDSEAFKEPRRKVLNPSDRVSSNHTAALLGKPCKEKGGDDRTQTLEGGR